MEYLFISRYRAGCGKTVNFSFLLMKTKIEKGLLLFFLVILFLPFLEQHIPFIESGVLKGGFKDADDAQFSINKWIDGSYQSQKGLYLNDKTGFRADMVRLNNQMDFSFFDKCHAGWGVAGKNQMLFQFPYIDAYYGNDFVGYDTIREKTRKLKAIQDTLRHSGKSLILVYAPSKATFYPEYFPDDRVQAKRGMTNSQAYRRIADSFGINQVDMDTWFASMKNKSKEMLFSKQGIHWTNYGTILAADSLMRYIEQLTNIHVRHPDWSYMEHSDKARFADDDIAKEFNLIFPIARETFAYPVIRNVADSGEKKPNVIYIGDSFGLKLAQCGMLNKMNSQCEMWYYFYDVIHLNDTIYSYTNKYDWQGAINKSDCVVLIYTSMNLKELGSGFIEAAYEHYYPGKK